MDYGPFQHHQSTKSTMLPRLSRAQLLIELRSIMPPCFRPSSPLGVCQHLPTSKAMLKGYLDQTRANAQSTRPPRTYVAAAANVIESTQAPDPQVLEAEVQADSHPNQDSNILPGNRCLPDARNRSWQLTNKRSPSSSRQASVQNFNDSTMKPPPFSNNLCRNKKLTSHLCHPTPFIVGMQQNAPSEPSRTTSSQVSAAARMPVSPFICGIAYSHKPWSPSIFCEDLGSTLNSQPMHRSMELSISIALHLHHPAREFLYTRNQMFAPPGQLTALKDGTWARQSITTDATKFGSLRRRPNALPILSPGIRPKSPCQKPPQPKKPQRQLAISSKHSFIRVQHHRYHPSVTAIAKLSSN
eukprot:scaffold154321_cov49-Attheya_sp.AAC.2